MTFEALGKSGLACDIRTRQKHKFQVFARNFLRHLVLALAFRSIHLINRYLSSSVCSVTAPRPGPSPIGPIPHPAFPLIQLREGLQEATAITFNACFVDVVVVAAAAATCRV